MNRRAQLVLVMILQIGCLILIGYEGHARQLAGRNLWPQAFLAVLVIFLGVAHIRRSGT